MPSWPRALSIWIRLASFLAFVTRRRMVRHRRLYALGPFALVLARLACAAVGRSARPPRPLVGRYHLVAPGRPAPPARPRPPRARRAQATHPAPQRPAHR